MEKTRVIVADVYVVDQATNEETRILGEMSFGRAEVDKAYPEDIRISRRHFRLIQAESEVLVEDLGSTNKTRINGKYIKPNVRYKLRSRDIIEFGQQKLQIFIGGQIQGEAMPPLPLQATKLEQLEQVERSIVFERFCSVDAITPAKSDLSVEGGIELGEDGDLPAESKKDDGIIQALIQKKNAAWYVQFGGSEFGPLTLKELKVIVKSKQFQGGTLFAFTEGLADWLPIEKLQRFLDGPAAEFTATLQFGNGAPLTGVVHCFFNPASTDKVIGRCETVTLSEITVQLHSAIPEGVDRFDIEVSPDPNSGIEKFRATVKQDSSRAKGDSYILLFIQAKPSTKMAIERYLRR